MGVCMRNGVLNRDASRQEEGNVDRVRGTSTTSPGNQPARRHEFIMACGPETNTSVTRTVVLGTLQGSNVDIVIHYLMSTWLQTDISRISNQIRLLI